MGRDLSSMVNEFFHQAVCCNNALSFAPSFTYRCMDYFTAGSTRHLHAGPLRPRMHDPRERARDSQPSEWAMRPFADNATPLKKYETAKAQYMAGDLPMIGASPYGHLAVALQSVQWGEHELDTVKLLQAMLGSEADRPASMTRRSRTRRVRQPPPCSIRSRA